MQTKKQNKKRIWIIALLLLICVAATTFTLVNRLGLFMPDAEGAVELTDPGADKVLEGSQAGGNADDSSVPGRETNYSFTAYDDKGEWQTETEVEIFSISYENGEAVATVVSDDGDNVIAPGTGNSYVFKFKNTGEEALDYTVTLEAYSTPAEAAIPVVAKLSRYDGSWVVGSNEAYADSDALNAAEDSATLGAGRYVFYTLDWQWQFDGDDEHDTLLGNIAAEQDITYTVKIKTVATASADTDNKGGIMIVQTGDGSSMTLLWIMLGLCAVLMMFMLLWKRDDEDEAEA